MAPLPAKRLKKFVERHATTKWVIASDYCLADPMRPLDSIVFSLFPMGEHFQTTMCRLDSIPNADLKEVRTVSPIVVQTLRGGGVLTFAFALDPLRRLFISRDDVRSSLSDSIVMMERWKNAGECQSLIAKFRAMKSELEKPSVNIKLITNIILVTLIVSYISMLLIKSGKVENIGWASDRDNMMTAFGGIARYMFSVNVSALCQKWGQPVPALGFFEQPNEDLWCDRFTRLPDYVAGAIASWDPPVSVKVRRKVNQVIEGALADNRYLFLFRVALMVADKVRKVEVSRTLISRNPIKAERARPKAKSVSALRGRSRSFIEQKA